jgi:hypothetical protein
MDIDRFTNAVYAWAVRHMDADHRRDFDRALERSATRGSTRRDPNAPPAFWKGDDDASASSIRLARQLGLAIPELGT